MKNGQFGTIMKRGPQCILQPSARRAHRQLPHTILIVMLVPPYQTRLKNVGIIYPILKFISKNVHSPYRAWRALRQLFHNILIVILGTPITLSLRCQIDLFSLRCQIVLGFKLSSFTFCFQIVPVPN